MNSTFNKTLMAGFAFAMSGLAHGQMTLSALTTFGGGDGWLSPTEYTNYGTDDSRGMAYNPVTGNLVLARSGSLRVLSGSTGVELGLMNITGIAGGARAINKVGISDDGQIFAANLTTSISPTATSNTFNIYRYSSESFNATATLAAASSIAFQGTPNTAVNGARLGDSFDVYGFGSNVAAIAGFGSVATTSTLSANTSGVARFDGLGVGGTVTAGFQTFTGASSGVARLGLTFVDGTSYAGTQGGSTTAARILDATGSSSTFMTLTTSTERAFDVMILDGVKYLSTIDTQGSVAATVTNGTGSVVRIYTLAGAVATLVTSANLVSGTQISNVNATGEIKWGKFQGITSGGYEGTLYAMNTNSGIQAYRVNVVPEPGTMAALGLGIAALARRRKNSK